ncbi:MAG: MFS transporter [Brevefilum sp.]|jgi:MFS family permease
MNNQKIKDPSKLSIWNPLFTNMFIINTLISLSTSMMNVIITKYAASIGASLTTVGLVSSLFALTALIFRFFVGPVIDYFNKRSVLIATFIIFFVSYLLVSFSNSIPILIFSRLLMGVGLAFSSTLILTNASNSLPVEKMGAGIGLLSLGSAISSAISPAIGLKLVEVSGYKTTFLINAGIMLTVLGFFILKKMKLGKRGDFSITLRTILSKEVLVPTIIFFLLGMTNHLFNAFLILYSEMQGVFSGVGYFFTISAITLIFARPLIGKLTDKYGLMWAVVPSLICFSASLILLSFSKTLGMFLVAGFLSAFGFSSVQPAIFAATMKNTDIDRRGAAISTSYIGIDLGTLTGPIVGGAIAGKFGYVWMWRVMIIPVLIALTIGLINRQELEPPPLATNEKQLEV